MMSAELTTENVLEAVRRLAYAELAYDGPLALDSRLIEDLALDSIRLLTLAVAVEDHFGVCLDEDDDASLMTVGDLVSIVLTKTSARTQAAEDSGSRD